MNAIKKVRMVFEKVNYRVLNARDAKEIAILADYDALLCDLMQECMVRGNNLTLQNIVMIVRKTNWHMANHSERIADIGESMLSELKTIDDDVTFELPSFVRMRVQRVFAAIHQAIGYQAKQWHDALPFNNGKESLKSLYDDLRDMEDYFAALTDLGCRLKCCDTHSSYMFMKYDAFNMLSEAKSAVWAKLHKDDEKELPQIEN